MQLLGGDVDDPLYDILCDNLTDQGYISHISCGAFYMAWQGPTLERV
jgi:hypothetical protein